MGFDLNLPTPVGFELRHPAAQLPVYATPEAAGADLFACEATIIRAHGRGLVKTGVHISMLPGIQAEIRSRSGLALKQGIMVLNSPGTIDADYRGEINVLLINHGREPFTIKRGERIAQMIVAPVTHATLVPVDGELSATARGTGGFGSTGR